MWSLLSHLGVSLQSELCTWILLGAIWSTFDATIFRINANLKQVWSMKMPGELTLSVQRVLRTMISCVVLVQCFTAHLYLASYIVLLYPVFLEEKPALVLPWLLVSAVRGLLCELLAMTLGLVSCLLVGAACAPCVVFVLRKLASIVPALYMWTLVYNYYKSLKMLTAFRSSAGGVTDYGFELAVRRGLTKSLLAETELRRNLISRGKRILSLQSQPIDVPAKTSYSSRLGLSISIPHTLELEEDMVPPIPISISPRSSDTTTFEEWINSDLPPRRNVDRILDQFVVMILKVSAYVSTRTCQDHISWSRLCLNIDQTSHPAPNRKGGRALTGAEPETPSQVGSGVREGASYLRDFPRIFNKRRQTNSNLFGSLDPGLMTNAASMRRDDSIQTDPGTTELSLQSPETSNSETNVINIRKMCKQSTADINTFINTLNCDDDPNDK